MKNSNIKVSIVVPVYNVEKYLPKCIDSIRSQTYENLEIILVDDGSSDNSGAIANQYVKLDKRIRVVHKKNEKVSAARNTGIDMATGEYICFADADDYLMPDYVEYLLELAIKHNADVAMSVDMFTTFHPNQVKGEWVKVKTPEEATIDILTYNMPIGVYCKIFRRDFLGTGIRFIPHIYIGEGFNFNTMAFQRANKIVEGNRRIYFYRRDNPTSATTKFRIDKWENAIYAIENIHKDLILHSDSIEVAWNYANWHTHCDAFNFLVISGEYKTYREEYKEWKCVSQKNAKYAFFVDIQLKEKVRALLMLVCPRLIPWLINQRNKRYYKGA